MTGTVPRISPRDTLQNERRPEHVNAPAALVYRVGLFWLSRLMSPACVSTHQRSAGAGSGKESSNECPELRPGLQAFGRLAVATIKVEF
jgi:hypothetical protein